MIIGHIGARKGSKGVPGKNFRPICGKPLNDWSLDHLFASPTIDAVVVSTDDEAIYAHALARGALPIGLRPAHLATDTAGKWGVWQHALAAVLRAVQQRLCSRHNSIIDATGAYKDTKGLQQEKCRGYPPPLALLHDDRTHKTHDWWAWTGLIRLMGGGHGGQGRNLALLHHQDFPVLHSFSPLILGKPQDWGRWIHPAGKRRRRGDAWGGSKRRRRGDAWGGSKLEAGEGRDAPRQLREQA